MNFFDLIIRDKTTKTLKAVELWEVRWDRRTGPWHGNIEEQVRVFTSEEEAKEFKTALKDAYKLLKHTSGTGVYLHKQSEQ